jgi:hypothetical protein
LASTNSTPVEAPGESQRCAAENLLFRRRGPQPYSRAAPLSIDKFNPGLFEGTADRLIIGAGDKTNTKTKVLAAVRLDIAASCFRDVLLGELNAIGSVEEATKWAHRRLAEKNKLNADDARHIEEAFAAKLLSFAIHHPEGLPESKTKNNAESSSTSDQGGKKRKSVPPSPAVDKSAMTHPEPRRIRDRDHVRFVAQQSCLLCGRQPCDAHHLRFAQNRALGRRVSDEFTVPLCRGHHRELHRHGDEAAWWDKLGLDPTGAARVLWLETHPQIVEGLFRFASLLKTFRRIKCVAKDDARVKPTGAPRA